MKEKLQKHFPSISSIEKIGEDGISLEIYRVLVPDEDDPDFEKEYIAIYDNERDDVVFTGAVLRGSEGVEIFPDFSKTFYMTKLKQLWNELVEKAKSEKLKEKRNFIFDPEVDIYVNESSGKYYLRYSSYDGVKNIFTTTRQDLVEIMEKLAEIRRKVFCEC